MSGNESSRDPSVAPRLDPRLLEVLVCPLTKAVLVYNGEKQELLSRKAGLAYPIRNGVPLMTAEAARHLTDEEIDKL
jgi:uncharacterized protein YbaR (Trm112 family)